MKLTEVAQAAFDDKTAKKMSKIVKAVKKEATRFDRNFTIEVTPYSYLKGEIAVHFQRYWSAEQILDAYKEIKDVIKKADEEGHIFKIEIGAQCTGEHASEAILTSLRPGMTLKAEALFPTIAFEVTWKNIVSSKG